jgi:outer membrane protein assembly factor BamB
MKTLIALASLMIFTSLAYSADKPLAWPQFRGPNGSGVADDQKPPIELGPDKNVKWKVPAPDGLSSPIVVADKLVITAFDDGKLFTIAYNRADGKEAWRADAKAKQIEGFMKVEGSPAASTPATDGTHIVSYFGSCGLVCYDTSGKELWRLEMPPVEMPGNFGSGVSPVLVDGIVVLVRDQMKDPKIIAVDVKSGKVKWEKKRLSVVSYCTPVIWDTPEGKQVAAPGHAMMVGYDLQSGDEKWTVKGMPSSVCSSPMVADGMLYFAGYSPGGPEDKENQMPSFDKMLEAMDKDKDGAISKAEAGKEFGDFFDGMDSNKDGKLTRDEWDAILKFMAEGKNSAFALKPGGTGDITKSNILWHQTKGLPYVTSAIMYHGRLIMVKDGGIVTAYDAKTGTQAFTERAAATGKYYASPVAANGHIYFTSLDGAITVLNVDSQSPTAVATNKLDERTAATPAIADNTMYIRTEKHLYAFANGK